MSNWVSYINGNYKVLINLDNGTKIRTNNLNTFEPTTVESFDLKITNQCDRGCKFCHENSTLNGKHGDLFAASFLDSLHPYTEIAVGGGNPLSHPDLEKFLIKCKERKFIPSMTVNQIHFEKEYDRIKKLIDEKLIYGLGISLVKVTADFIAKVQSIPTAVIHIINGISTSDDFYKLGNKNIKILILGYKEVRRGDELYKKDQISIDKKKDTLYSLLPTIIEDKWFNVVSFDNLALKQLDVKRFLSDKEWESFYMGDDGIDGKGTSSSMFIDLVERKFAKNSCDLNRYDLLNTVEEMYSFLYKKD